LTKKALDGGSADSGRSTPVVPAGVPVVGKGATIEEVSDDEN